MSERLIEELSRENLCTHFVLPLLKLNKFSFVASNFVNSYLSQHPESKRWSIVVQIIDPIYCHEKVWMHPQYYAAYKDSHYTYLEYVLPTDLYFDIETFLAGKFSEMSIKAKEKIRTWSGLVFREVDSYGIVVTDARLQALDRSPTLKAMWDRVIEPAEELNGELLSIPDERTYINLTTLTRIKKPGQ